MAEAPTQLTFFNPCSFRGRRRWTTCSSMLNFSFSLGKEVICCSVQLLNHLSLKPAVSPIVTLETISPVHIHTEAHLHSCGLKVSTSDFYIHFKAGPHCQMFSKQLWSKLSLGLIKPIYAVSFSKAHVYEDLLGT